MITFTIMKEEFMIIIPHSFHHHHQIKSWLCPLKPIFSSFLFTLSFCRLTLFLLHVHNAPLLFHYSILCSTSLHWTVLIIHFGLYFHYCYHSVFVDKPHLLPHHRCLLSLRQLRHPQFQHRHHSLPCHLVRTDEWR